MGDAVVNRHGEELGRVADVLLDLQLGRIASVMVATGGVLGIGGTRVPVPWGSLRCDRERRCVVTDADRLVP